MNTFLARYGFALLHFAMVCAFVCVSGATSTAQTRSTRYRRVPIPNQIGKNHELVREAFHSIVDKANPSVVSIMNDGRRTSLGTVISADGYVLAKQSEIGKGSLECRVANVGVVSARSIATDKSTDLVLIKVAATGLQPVTWAKTNAPDMGSWVCIPSGRGSDPLVIGVVSTRQHRVSRDAPMLGVLIDDTDNGLRVTRVLPGGTAAEARIRRDDVILSIDKTPIRTSNDLTRALRKYRPDAPVTLRIRRDGETLNVKSRLGRAADIANAEQGVLAHEGGPLSRRRSDFPRVIENDCLVLPNQCGGPLVNVDGHAIGLNIARASRVSSYALPKDVVVDALKRMRN